MRLKEMALGPFQNRLKKLCKPVRHNIAYLKAMLPLEQMLIKRPIGWVWKGKLFFYITPLTNSLL